MPPFGSTILMPLSGSALCDAVTIRPTARPVLLCTHARTHARGDGARKGKGATNGSQGHMHINVIYVQRHHMYLQGSPFQKVGHGPSRGGCAAAITIQRQRVRNMCLTHTGLYLFCMYWTRDREKGSAKQQQQSVRTSATYREKMCVDITCILSYAPECFFFFFAVFGDCFLPSPKRSEISFRLYGLRLARASTENSHTYPTK